MSMDPSGPENTRRQCANVRDCFTGCVGRTVVGVLFDALPVNRPELASGSKTLVFDDGMGLTVRGTAFWVDSAADVQRAIGHRAAELERATAELQAVLALASGGPKGHPKDCAA